LLVRGGREARKSQDTEEKGKGFRKGDQVTIGGIPEGHGLRGGSSDSASTWRGEGKEK